MPCSSQHSGNIGPGDLNGDCASLDRFVYNSLPPSPQVSVRKSISIIALLVIAAIPAHSATAQRDALVRVRVVDSTGTPIANAEVSALHGLTTVVPGGPTDSLGRRSFTVPRGGDYELVVRRIGYQRGEQFFSAIRDSVGLRIALRNAPTSLPAVSVTAQEDVKRKAYHLDADDIAASTRPIIDGLDLITKLRPDIAYSRVPKCAARFIWVNGRRIVFPPLTDPALATRLRQQRHVARATPHIGPTGLATVNLTIQSVLTSIHPEHVEELNFADCNDTSVDKVNANSAIFVTLKPGVAFEPGIGSYVVQDGATAIDRTVATDATTPTPPAAYRNRLLGLFDNETGEPIVGAEVADSTSGTFATTTQTGTISLIFLPEGMTTLRIRKAGYAELRLPVVISPKDSVPITLTLTKSK
jgi:hypothetical protein